MFHNLKEIGKPSSSEDRISIPPNVAREDRGTPTVRCQYPSSVRNSQVDFLPEGSLSMWPLGHRQLPRELSDKELGRFTRILVQAGEDADRVVRSLVTANGSGGGMYPPPVMPPTDPGGEDADGNDDQRAGESTNFPIADNEFGILRPVHDEVVKQLAFRGKEEAGLLFGPKGTQVATHFFRDKHGDKTASSFTLETKSLNAIISSLLPLLDILAVVHCHPNNVWHPSGGDIHYVRSLFAHPRNDAAQFFMPLVVNGQLIPYLLYRDEPDRVVHAGLKIIG